ADDLPVDLAEFNVTLPVDLVEFRADMAVNDDTDDRECAMAF
ncbi:hypothetical protein AeMF1_003604, partial [Aphanomyces euteiches]